MPYIEKAMRSRFGTPPATARPKTPGELNYCITMLVKRYIADNANLDTGVNYTLLNEIMGALECAKIEFYRRAMIPYETTKIRQNGDVYL